MSRDYHLNVVRICIWDQYQNIDPASVAPAVDRLVDWAEQDGIYAIVNWHNDYANYSTSIDLNQAYRIWDFYAPRYANRKHVIFEGSNETNVDADKQAAIYSRIRSHAPSSHIILWSVPSTDRLPFSMIQSASGISYANASIGYHAYGGIGNHDTAISWRNAGYPIICTEVPSDPPGTSWSTVDYSVLMPHTKKVEASGISWVNWMSAAPVLPRGDMSFTPQYISELSNYGIGFWPATYQSAIVNAGFESGGYGQTPLGWSTWSPHQAYNQADYVEGYARTGNARLTHWLNTDYEVYTFQTVTHLPNGTYKLTAWTQRSGSITASNLVVKNYGGDDVNMPTLETTGWNQVVIDNIVVTNNQMEIGLYTKGGANA